MRKTFWVECKEDWIDKVWSLFDKYNSLLCFNASPIADKEVLRAAIVKGNKNLRGNHFRCLVYEDVLLGFGGLHTVKYVNLNGVKVLSGKLFIAANLSGSGKGIMELIEQSARELNINLLIVETRADNVPMIRLAERSKYRMYKKSEGGVVLTKFLG